VKDLTKRYKSVYEQGKNTYRNIKEMVEESMEMLAECQTLKYPKSKHRIKGYDEIIESSHTRYK
jgi:hypothetical protein